MDNILSMKEDELIKAQIYKLFENCRIIYLEKIDIKYFSEEDTKVKLIFPLFEILGWDFRNYHETEFEFAYEDTQGLLKIDCVFKLNNKHHIWLECKHLNQSLLPTQYKQGKRIINSAKEFHVKYVVFTNFLKMDIIHLSIDPNGNAPIHLDNVGEYISNYEKMKILRKPNDQNVIYTLKAIPKCFEKFTTQSDCEKLNPNCERICKSICHAAAELKLIGYKL